MKAEVIIKEISVNSVKCYQGIKDIQTTRKDRLGHFVQDILDLISGKNTKMISVSKQSNPWELSLVTGRATLYSASPVWVEDNQKESSDHLEFCGVLPPPPPHPQPGQISSSSSAGCFISENYNNQQILEIIDLLCCVPHFFSLKDSQ